jgi:hypothetical protein
VWSDHQKQPLIERKTAAYREKNSRLSREKQPLIERKTGFYVG